MRFVTIAVLVFAALRPAFAQPAPSLGVAENFAVLAQSRVTSASPTTVSGNAGVSGEVGVSGLAFAVGEAFANDARARAAQQDATKAYDDLAGRTCIPSASTLGGVRMPGVYCLDAANLPASVTLDAGGNPDAVWIFRIEGSLTTAAHSAVILAGGGHDRNIFWQVAGPVTLGAESTFLGTVAALDDITVSRGANISGRLLTQRGAVSFDGDRISVCCGHVALSRASLPGGTAGTVYREAVGASGGFAPYAFSVTEGALPPSLTLDRNTGTLAGTPSKPGIYVFTVTAADALGCSGSTVYEIAIGSCPITILSGPPPRGTVGVRYRHVFTAGGGTPPYEFRVTSGSVPDGLNLLSTGVIDDVPRKPGCFTFTLTITDANGCTFSQSVTICIDCGVMTIVPDALPAVDIGAAYDVTLTADGGIGPYTFELAGGALPDGIDPRIGNGRIMGRPTKAGCYTFTVKVTDSVSGCTATKSFTICVRCAAPITITPSTVPGGVVGVEYSASLAAAGGTPPYTFNAPPVNGLVVSGNTLKGFPEAAGCFTVTVTVTDAAGCTGTITYTACFCPAFTISPPSLPAGTINVPYPLTKLSASPGTGHAFAVTAGALPPGMMPLSPDGTLSGTPTASGLYTFTVTATLGDCSGTRTYSIFIRPVIVLYPPASAPLLSLDSTIALMLVLGVAGFVTLRGARG
jgi:hypothetical protein